MNRLLSILAKNWLDEKTYAPFYPSRKYFAFHTTHMLVESFRAYHYHFSLFFRRTAIARDIGSFIQLLTCVYPGDYRFRFRLFTFCILVLPVLRGTKKMPPPYTEKTVNYRGMYTCIRVKLARLHHRSFNLDVLLFSHSKALLSHRPPTLMFCKSILLLAFCFYSLNTLCAILDPH